MARETTDYTGDDTGDPVEAVAAPAATETQREGRCRPGRRV
jgi:hypothetical protein